MRRLALLVAGMLGIAALVRPLEAGRPKGHPAPAPPTGALVGRVRDAVRGIVAARAATQEAEVRKLLAAAQRFPAEFKLPVRLKASADPWAGFVTLESYGLHVARQAGRGGNVLGPMVDLLVAAGGRKADEAAAPARGKLATLADHVRYVKAVLDEAARLRAAALAKMPDRHRQFMLKHPALGTRALTPQIKLANKNIRVLCNNDRAFCGFSFVQCDWSKLAASAKVLAALNDEAFLASFARACNAAKPQAGKVPGVTGKVLHAETTAHGLLVIGAAGPNVYRITKPLAFLADAGGKDNYGEMIGSPSDAAHGIAVAIDLGGDDRYGCKAYGLATGRLGVGLVVDRGGDDTYILAACSGGVGLGGIGILADADGDDTYVGSRLTQGAGYAGVGLLLDLAGNDKHTSHRYAVGFGAPAGVGAVIDVAGDDAYQCGRHDSSNYNRTDAPDAKPGDPEFQYTAYGLGTGMGRRILSNNAADHEYSLAGGMGMVIDLAGDDKYDSSNFSQGCGYFFGVGLKLDLAGTDTHAAARYGHAAGAHYGMGLFVDYAGADTYTSTGPTYNGGCAWDRSAFVCIDGGDGDDTYALKRSSGLGRADIKSWAVFADMGGNDRYITGGGLGAVSRTSVAVFYDRAGKDDYGRKGSGREDGKTLSTSDGGIFVDAP